MYCCQFDDRRIVSGGGDNLVIIWHASTADIEAKLTGHTGEVVRTLVILWRLQFLLMMMVVVVLMMI